MLFTSYEFLGFLAVLLLLYYLVPKRFQWQLLLAASYLFYFLTGPSNLIYILAATVTTYLAGWQIARIGERQSAYLKEHKAELDKEAKKAYKAGMKHKQWLCLLLCLLFNIGVLAVVKYTNFVMGYLIDVYRGVVPAERNPFKLALFVSFFPQLVQGPISRFGDLAVSLFEQHRFDGRTVSFGLQRVLWGFFKKLVIADRMLVGVNAIVRNPESYSGAYVFLGMLFYALELYADFTGGIDITIGVAETLGIRVTENFIRPYFSKSIKEYWRRWHITMGTWFTDYIFYPISVCKPMLKFSRFSRAHFGEQIGKRMPVYLSSFAVWFATGWQTGW